MKTGDVRFSKLWMSNARVQRKQGTPESVRGFCKELMGNGSGGYEIDAQETMLTTGIILCKLLFPLIVEERQIVIVTFGDRLEVDGLPRTGACKLLRNEYKSRESLVTLFRPVAVSGSENNSSWNLPTILIRQV